MPQLFGLKAEQYICYSYFSKTKQQDQTEAMFSEFSY